MISLIYVFLYIGGIATLLAGIVAMVRRFNFAAFYIVAFGLQIVWVTMLLQVLPELEKGSAGLRGPIVAYVGVVVMIITLTAFIGYTIESRRADIARLHEMNATHTPIKKPTLRIIK